MVSWPFRLWRVIDLRDHPGPVDNFVLYGKREPGDGSLPRNFQIYQILTQIRFSMNLKLIPNQEQIYCSKYDVVT